MIIKNSLIRLIQIILFKENLDISIIFEIESKKCSMRLSVEI